jgi:hypothetical protein
VAKATVRHCAGSKLLGSGAYVGEHSEQGACMNQHFKNLLLTSAYGARGYRKSTFFDFFYYLEPVQKVPDLRRKYFQGS